jgi:hypothetical protein
MHEFYPAAGFVVDGDRLALPDRRTADARFVVHCQ